MNDQRIGGMPRREDVGTRQGWSVDGRMNWKCIGWLRLEPGGVVEATTLFPPAR